MGGYVKFTFAFGACVLTGAGCLEAAAEVLELMDRSAAGQCAPRALG